MEIAVAGGVAVLGVADVGGVVGLGGCPLVGTLGQINGLGQGGSGDGVHALVAADVVDQQVVVVILQLTLGGLQIAAVLVDELVGEGVLDRRLAGRPCLVTAGRPLVPARNEQDLGILLQRIVELHGELVAPLGGLGALYLVAVLVVLGVGAADDVEAVHGCALIRDVVVVDRHADGHLLHGLVLVAVTILVVHGLRIGGEPAPVARLHALDDVGRLTRTPGKEFPNLLVEIGGNAHVVVIGHEYGLFVPVEPQLLVAVGAVEIQVEHFQLLQASLGGAEGQKEGDLGGLHRAGIHGVDPSLKQGGVAGFPRVVTVGVIGKHGIHPRVGQ